MRNPRLSITAPIRSTALLSLLALAVVLGLSSQRAGATSTVDQSGARKVVREAVDQVLAVLARKDLSVQERRSLIEDIAFERFDFETMARLVLKRDWRRFSASQRQQFVKEFREYLAASYGSRVERYQQEKVKLTGARVEPRGDVTVMTRIQGGPADGVEIDYRMRDRDAKWKVIDVVIEGVSLVQNFHTQFAGVISNGGPDELLRKLKEHNARAASAG